MEFVLETVDSVRAQTFEDWELILVDDCSQDQTRVLLDRLAIEDPRIRVRYLEKNSGPAVSRNTGIELAQGRFIAFLDSDDVWHPEKLARQVRFMEETGATLSYHSYSMFDETLSRRFSTFIVPESTNYAKSLYRNVISMCAAMYDTEKTGGKVYMPLIRKRQDYGLFLRILKQGHTALGLKDDLLKVRIREGSVSANKWVAAQYQWRIYRQIEHLGLIRSSFYFVVYATYGVRKYFFKWIRWSK